MEPVLRRGYSERFGSIYRKKRGKEHVNEEERHGWAKGRGDYWYEVFRSRVTDEWITEKEFRAEYAELKRQCIGGIFTSRKGFKRVAEPCVNLTAYLQAGVRRIAVTWQHSNSGKGLTLVNLKRGDFLC